MKQYTKEEIKSENKALIRAFIEAENKNKILQRSLETAQNRLQNLVERCSQLEHQINYYERLAKNKKY